MNVEIPDTELMAEKLGIITLCNCGKRIEIVPDSFASIFTLKQILGVNQMEDVWIHVTDPGKMAAVRCYSDEFPRATPRQF